MKVKHFLPVILLILCACEGEEIDPGRGSRGVALSAEIDGMKTRATGASWEKDDAVGIYMVKAGAALNASALEQNVKYTSSGGTSFEPAKEEDEIVFPFDGSKVDFIGYYPYREEILDFVYPVDLGNQTQQANIDLMYSANAKGFDSKNPNVGMLFSRQLSKIVLNITHAKSVNLNNLSVIITNAGTRAGFNLATGALSAPTDRGNIALKTSTDGKKAEAILLPETDLTGMELWFILGDEEEVYKFVLEEALEIDSFKKSTYYTYNVTLFTEEYAVVTQGSITDWTEGPSSNATAKRTNEEAPLIKGSKKAPFTVAEAQANLGQSQVWVEGYIVGSFKSSSMGSFTADVTEASASNLALADNRHETETSGMIPVQLISGTNLRDALNLVDNPDKIQTKVMIKGNLESYFSVTGLRDGKEYALIDP